MSGRSRRSKVSHHHDYADKTKAERRERKKEKRREKMDQGKRVKMIAQLIQERAAEIERQRKQSDFVTS